MLLPGAVAIVSPIGDEEGASRASDHSRLRIAYSQPALVEPLTSAAVISVSLDSAIFRNGVELGPDHAGLGRQYACERNVVIAEAQAVTGIASDPTKVKALLESSASPKQENPTSTCQKEALREAQHLLSLDGALGSSSLVDELKQLANLPPVQLRKLNQQPKQ